MTSPGDLLVDFPPSLVDRAIVDEAPRSAWQLFVDDWVRLGG